MSEIDKQRIENYFKGEYSSDEEKYLGNAFSEATNVEALKAILKDQWNESFTEDASEKAFPRYFSSSDEYSPLK